MSPDHMDDGLTRAWALYWAAVQAGSLRNDSHAKTSTAAPLLFSNYGVATTASTPSSASTTPEMVSSSSTTTETAPLRYAQLLSAASCSSPLHEACNHLDGYCCPSLVGAMRSCCSSPPTITKNALETTMSPASSSTRTSPAMTTATTTTIAEESESTSAEMANVTTSAFLDRLGAASFHCQIWTVLNMVLLLASLLCHTL